ncbi:thioredoxin domain-containing protein [Nocardioides hungaricus]
MSKRNRETGRTARAAAAIEEQQRQESRRRNRMIGTVVLAVVLIVVLGFALSRALDTTTDVSAPAAGSDFGLTIGPGDAPREVVVYEDYLCPFCGQFEAATRDDLEQLAADGKVRVEYRPFNLLGRISDYSERSAGAFSIVLEKSGADVAKKFHDLLFENQPSESGPFPSNSELVDLAVEAGAQESAVRDAIENGDGKQWVADATQAAEDAGVRGTPTILLDGKVFQDGQTMDEIAQNLIDGLR